MASIDPSVEGAKDSIECADRGPLGPSPPAFALVVSIIVGAIFRYDKDVAALGDSDGDGPRSDIVVVIVVEACSVGFAPHLKKDLNPVPLLDSS